MINCHQLFTIHTIKYFRKVTKYSTNMHFITKAYKISFMDLHKTLSSENFFKSKLFLCEDAV